MWLVLSAMRRPITILVAVISVALCAFLALRRMPVDIFPNLGAPTIFVAQPYGGMDPAQMEGFLTYYYEYHFLYITGHRARGIEEHPGRRADEARVPPGHRHEPGDGAGCGLCEPRALLHAARRGAAVHRALRRGQRAGGATGVFEPHPQPGRDAEHRAEPGAARCLPRCRAFPRRRRSAATSAPSWCGSTPSG